MNVAEITRRTRILHILLGRITLGIALLLLALALAGCKKDPKVTFIQGLWYYKNAHLANIPAESAQVTEWEFDHSYFSVDSCCFTEAHYSGNYYVSDRKENQLTLELINMRGQIGDMILGKDDTQTIVVKINTEDDTILISRDGPYTRVLP